MPLNIVFMGTPDFAVPSLSRLLADSHRVSGVFSQPDRRSGRGMTLSAPPVKRLAVSHGIPVFQPTALRDGSAAELMRSLSPDLVVVVAYGRILPPELLELPPLGCVNVHASLLPRLRGAAPIQWSIIRGDTQTGVTTMYMAEGLDTGDMILTQSTPIGKDETAGELSGRLSVMGAELLSETISLIMQGKAPRTSQDETMATFAPIIDKDLARLDFSASPTDFCNLIRGLHPSPGAYALMGGNLLKVHKAAPVTGLSGAPGELLDQKRLIAGCGGGAVELLAVQPQGKKTMDGGAYLNGLRGACGLRFD